MEMKQNKVSVTSANNNKYFYELAQKIRPIREKADTYKEETGERYLYTPEELAIVQEVNEIVELQMRDFIYDFLHRGGYDSFKAQFSDFYSMCILKVFERFPWYNGECTLSTFIVRDLKGVVNIYIGKERGLSQYYNEQNVKIQRVIKEMTAKGVEPTVPEIYRIINERAAKNNKISEKTIRTVLDMNKSGAPCSLENCENLMEGSFESPEESYFKSEDARMVHEILSSLLPYERIAFKLINDVVDEETGPHRKDTFISGSTYKDVGRQTSLIEAVKAAGKEEWVRYGVIPATKVEEIVGVARRKINSNPEVMSRLDALRQVYAEDIEMSSEDAIKSAEDLIISDMFDD